MPRNPSEFSSGRSPHAGAAAGPPARQSGLVNAPVSLLLGLSLQSSVLVPAAESTSRVRGGPRGLGRKPAAWKARTSASRLCRSPTEKLSDRRPQPSGADAVAWPFDCPKALPIDQGPREQSDQRNGTNYNFRCSSGLMRSSPGCQDQENDLAASRLSTLAGHLITSLPLRSES